MEYQPSGSGKWYFIIFIIIIVGLIAVAWYFNSFHIRQHATDLKNMGIDAIDNRPKQLISQNPPSEKAYCVQTPYTNILGYDEINKCCVYEWRNREHILQICNTAQVNGNIIYTLWDGNYVTEDYKYYLEQIQ